MGARSDRTAGLDRLLDALRGVLRPEVLPYVGIGALSTFAIYAILVFPLEIALGRRGLETVTAAPAPSAAPIASDSAPSPGPPDAAASADAGDAGSDALADAAPEPGPTVWRVQSLAEDPGYEIVHGEIGHRPVLGVLAQARVSRTDAQKLLHAFDGVRDLARARPKDTFVLAKAKPDGHLVAFEYATGATEVWQAREEDGALSAKKLELPIDEHRLDLAFAVEGDLRATVKKAGLDEDILALLDDALGARIQLSDLRGGARLRLVAVEDRVAGEFLRYRELDAVEYLPADTHASALRVYHLPGADAHAFYDAKGQQPYHGGWHTPVPFARIASRFNPHRMHPVLHVVMPHNGVDFAAAPGTPVYATQAGIVKLAGNAGPCGNEVRILHPDGLVSAYCHLSRFAAGLRVGQHVDSQQLIGYVGATGRVTGPHLHFAIKRGEKFLDPLSLKLDGVRVVPASDRNAFDDARTKLDAELDGIALPNAPASAGAGDEKEEKAGEEDLDEMGLVDGGHAASP